MRRLVKITLLLCLLCGLGSCAMFSGAQRRAKDPMNHMQKFTDPGTGKEVVFIPMNHLNPEERFGEIRACLDRMKAEGYVTFCEKAILVPYHIDTVDEVTVCQLAELKRPLSSADSMRLDTLTRKCRRMLGLMIGEKGYADSANRSLPHALRNKKHVVMQTTERLGLMTDRDLWVDYSMPDLIGVYERKHGKIELTNYDFETGLFEKYRPSDPVSLKNINSFVLLLRNDYIVRRIVTSEHSKIAVVYGAAHTPGIVRALCKIHGYKNDGKYRQ